MANITKEERARRAAEAEKEAGNTEDKPVVQAEKENGSYDKEPEPKNTEQGGVVREVVEDGDYKIEVIKDYYGNVDPFYLSKKDPNYAYRFLRDDPKNLSLKTGNLLFDKGGWQLCQKNHLVKLGIEERFISPDGLYRVGDQVLAFMPKKLFEEKEQIKKVRATEPTDQVQRLLSGGDPNTGGQEIHQSMKGVQTQKALGM